MTRINAGVNPKYLMDEHLLAEHREIRRLPLFWESGLGTGNINRIPKSFTLNTGHISFFLDKFQYTYNRNKLLNDECINRGYTITDFSSNWSKVTDKNYWGDYFETLQDASIITKRIMQKVAASPKKYFHYRGLIVSKWEVIKLMEAITTLEPQKIEKLYEKYLHISF